MLLDQHGILGGMIDHQVHHHADPVPVVGSRELAQPSSPGYRKRLHVVETRPADREQPHVYLTPFIAEVHEMKASVPALNEEGPQEQLALGEENRLTCLLRRSNDGRSWTLTAINADPHERHEATVRDVDVDLATAVEITPGRQGARLGRANRVAVNPGEIRVFAGST